MFTQKQIIIAGVTGLIVMAGYAYVYSKTKEEYEPFEPDTDLIDVPDVPVNPVDPVNNTPMQPANNIPTQPATVRNFSVSEFKCKDGTPVPAQYLGNVNLLMQNLQVLRDAIGRPIMISSGYRSPAHNASVGGKKNSFHLRAMAADIKVVGMTPAQVRSKIESLIASGAMKQGGLGSYPTFTHYDVRGYRARWKA